MAPKDQKVAENGIVSFFCKASGNPAPDIHWRKNGKRVAINRQRYMGIDMPHGNVLRIEPVRSRRDDAHFECVADNGIGEPATASASLEIYPEGEGRSIQLKKNINTKLTITKTQDIKKVQSNTFTQINTHL